MNPIYEEMKQREVVEVAEAVHKFVDAVDAFQKLTPNQKQCFFQNIVLQRYLAEVLNDDQFVGSKE